MNKKARYLEAAAVLTVLLVLAGIPLLLWYWRAIVVPGKYAPGTKLFHLTAIADRGFWTEQQIVGYDYWWKNPARVGALRLTEGDHVVLLLHSPDVQHSFVMRDLHIGPVAVPAGHTVEVKFDVDAAREMEFLCTQVCGRDHSHMKGSFLVGQRAATTKGSRGADSPVPPNVQH